jgi:hypothetical protein
MDLTTSFRGVIPHEIQGRYELAETRNAAAILATTNHRAFTDLIEILQEFSLLTSDLTTPGGQESALAGRLNHEFRVRGWREAQVNTRVHLELERRPFAEAGEEKATLAVTESLSEGYRVDNILGRVAMDLEWNAKDGNLDRDIAAYRALYQQGLIDVGVLITRTQGDLRELARRVRLEAGMDETEAKKMLSTTTTTNLVKLLPRMLRGDAGGCPMLTIAICDRTWEGHNASRHT